MITFDECGAMLDEIADSMPYELYRDLNGGISLLPQLKVHPKALNNDLFILGEYIRNSLGNAIVFYYGSINRVYGSLDNEEYRKKLVEILHHEVRHHNEYLAGCDDLGIFDRNQIDDYLRKYRKYSNEILRGQLSQTESCPPLLSYLYNLPRINYIRI